MAKAHEPGCPCLACRMRPLHNDVRKFAPMVECQTCGGSKEVLNPNPPGSALRYWKVKCPRCDGRGHHEPKQARVPR